MVSSATPVVDEQHGLGLMQAQTTLDFLCGAFSTHVEISADRKPSVSIVITFTLDHSHAAASQINRGRHNARRG